MKNTFKWNIGTLGLCWGGNRGNSSVLPAELLTTACVPHLKKIRFKCQHTPLVAHSTSDFEKDSPGNSMAYKILIFLHQQKVPCTSSPYSSSFVPAHLEPAFLLGNEAHKMKQKTPCLVFDGGSEDSAT